MTNLRRFAGTYDKLICEKCHPHNPKVVGSNPAPATTFFIKKRRIYAVLRRFGALSFLAASNGFLTNSVFF